MIETLQELKKLKNKYQTPFGIAIWGFTSPGTAKEILVDSNGKLQITPPRATDHVFKPEVDVTDSEPVEVDVNSFLVSIRPQDGDVKANFGREITSSEYTVIPKDTIKVVGRYVDKIYLLALTGQTSKVRVEGLKS